jgi:hypothetical protein
VPDRWRLRAVGRVGKMRFTYRGTGIPISGRACSERRAGADMKSPTHYLKIDLGENDAFSRAQWLPSVRGATPFETNVEALGVKSMMPGASGVIGVNERFYVIKVDDIAGLGSGGRQR